MNSIYWLASYPKSGNTWVRAFLTSYLDEKRQRLDINALAVFGASARRWFDEYVGVEASMLPDPVIQRLRPQLYRCMAGDFDRPLFLKIHDAWSLTDQGEPLIPADVTGGVIYIVRNPLDIVPSFAHHYGISIPEAIERMCAEHPPADRLAEGLSDQIRQYFASWGGHARSWLDDSGLPVHVVRYEDLRADPEAAFARIVRFAGLPFDDERLRWATAQADFDALRQQEQAGGFRERLPAASAPFFRRGQVGVWRDDLPPALATRLIEAHHDVMRRFGYLNDEGAAV